MSDDAITLRKEGRKEGCHMEGFRQGSLFPSLPLSSMSFPLMPQNSGMLRLLLRPPFVLRESLQLIPHHSHCKIDIAERDVSMNHSVDGVGGAQKE